MVNNKNMNSVDHAGFMAGAWALARSMAEKRAERYSRNSMQWEEVQTPDQLKRALSGMVEPDTWKSKYVPRAVIRELEMTPDISDNGGKGSTWPRQVVKYGFVHEGVHVNFAVVCSRKEMKVGDVHTKLLRTLVFGIDCIMKAVQVAMGLGSLQDSHALLPKDVRATCVLLHCDRVLPAQPGEPITPEHVNAGVTSLMERDILVYRAQHVHKVLIHELIHAFGLDAGLFSFSGCRMRVENELMVQLNYRAASSSSGINTYEGFTEALACYWHMFLDVPRDTLYNGRCRSAGTQNLTELLQNIRGTWARERQLFLRTCRLLLQHMSNDSGRDGYDSGSMKQLFRESGIREHTNVFAYFFGKSALWDHLDVMPCVCLEGTGGGGVSAADAASFSRSSVQQFCTALSVAFMEDGSTFWDDLARTRPAEHLCMTSVRV